MYLCMLYTPMYMQRYTYSAYIHYIGYMPRIFKAFQEPEALAAPSDS